MLGAVLHSPGNLRFEERAAPKIERRAFKALLRP